MIKKYLLISEKEDDLRSQLCLELEELTQMVTMSASDGVQAYQKSRNQKFDVILSEFNMPKLTGKKLLTSLREELHNEHTPIIIYTENIEDTKIVTRDFPHLIFLTKPTSYSDIAKKIKEVSEKDLTKKLFKLDVDFINPFIDSSMQTLNKLCGVNNIEAMPAYIFANEEMKTDISGTLTISSPYFKGVIAISFDNNVYKDIMSRMLEENVGEIDFNNQDGAAEIINIIYGQTKAVLNKKGYKLSRAIPAVMRGRGHKVTTDTKTPILLVPFRSDLGNFWIQICVKAI